MTDVKGRVVYTLNDIGVCTLSPKRQDELADKLINHGFGPEDLAAIYREAKRTTASEKAAVGAVVQLLSGDPSDIRRVIHSAKPESKKMIPGEGQWTKPSEIAHDHARKSRMAYAIVCHDRKTPQEAADVIGCDVRDIPILVEDGRALQKAEMTRAQEGMVPTEEEHMKKVEDFRRRLRERQPQA
jgi:hypothetical protein